jgi:hypothetical protein
VLSGGNTKGRNLDGMDCNGDRQGHIMVKNCWDLDANSCKCPAGYNTKGETVNTATGCSNDEDVELMLCEIDEQATMMFKEDKSHTCYIDNFYYRVKEKKKEKKKENDKEKQEQEQKQKQKQHNNNNKKKKEENKEEGEEEENEKENEKKEKEKQDK